MTYCEVTHTEKSSFRALWFMFCHEGAIEFSGKVEHRGGSYLSDLIDEKYSTQQFQFRLSDYLQVLCRPTVRVRVCVWACVCACVCACTMACACNKHLRGEVKARKENIQPMRKKKKTNWRDQTFRSPLPMFTTQPSTPCWDASSCTSHRLPSLPFGCCCWQRCLWDSFVTSSRFMLILFCSSV